MPSQISPPSYSIPPPKMVSADAETPPPPGKRYQSHHPPHTAVSHRVLEVSQWVLLHGDGKVPRRYALEGAGSAVVRGGGGSGFSALTFWTVVWTGHPLSFAALVPPPPVCNPHLPHQLLCRMAKPHYPVCWHTSKLCSCPCELRCASTPPPTTTTQNKPYPSEPVPSVAPRYAHVYSTGPT